MYKYVISSLSLFLKDLIELSHLVTDFSLLVNVSIELSKAQNWSDTVLLIKILIEVTYF